MKTILFQGMNVPEIVPEEFSCLEPQPVTDPNLTGYEHPISKSNHHYILGDRFYANNHPHNHHSVRIMILTSVHREQPSKPVIRSPKTTEKTRKDFALLVCSRYIRTFFIIS